jgi:hypothetical protein
MGDLLEIKRLDELLQKKGPKVSSEAMEEYNKKYSGRAITPNETFNYLKNKDYFTILGEVSYSKEVGRYLKTYKTSLYASNTWLEKQEYSHLWELVDKHKPKRDKFRRRKYGIHTVKELIEMERTEILTRLAVILNELGPKISFEFTEEYNLLNPDSSLSEKSIGRYLRNKDYFISLGKVKGPKRRYGKDPRLRALKVDLYATHEWLEAQDDSLEEIIEKYKPKH